MTHAWEESTRAEYIEKGLGSRSGFGLKPALLIVDFSNGFTDPNSPLGGDFDSELAVTLRLLQEFRRGGFPVVYTTVAYDADYRDAGIFIEKIPALSMLVAGSDWVEIDQRIAPTEGDEVIVKKYASAFFGTELDRYFHGQGVDSVVITGATTSGCVRASAVDSLQYGFRTIVCREGVGDRAEGPHHASLFDMDAKYCDVKGEDEIIEQICALIESGGLQKRVDNNFRQWWQSRLPTRIEF